MRALVPFFTSYAHHDKADVKRFREILEPVLRASTSFEFGEWTDHQILAGKRWSGEIENALREARFGLLLLSPQFFARRFITEKELPKLLAKPMVVPVALQQFPLDGSMDLKGLGERQIFYDSKQRSFDACRNQPERRNFALELFGQITALLKKGTL